MVGADPDAVGAVVRDVVTTGARVAAFVGDPSDPVDADALSEMLAELFPAIPVVPNQPDRRAARR